MLKLLLTRGLVSKMKKYLLEDGTEVSLITMNGKIATVVGKDRKTFNINIDDLSIPKVKKEPKIVSISSELNDDALFEPEPVAPIVAETAEVEPESIFEPEPVVTEPVKVSIKQDNLYNDDDYI